MCRCRKGHDGTFFALSSSRRLGGRTMSLVLSLPFSVPLLSFLMNYNITSSTLLKGRVERPHERFTIKDLVTV